MVATPDDTIVSRGETTPSARDNTLLEVGLLVGALGRNRTFLLVTGELKLPTDILGLTRLLLSYRADGNLRAAVNGATLHIEERSAASAVYSGRTSLWWGPAHHTALRRDIDLLCDNAVAQGWTVKTNSPTRLRPFSPRQAVQAD